LARTQWPKLIYLDLSKNLFTHEAVSHILRTNWNKSSLAIFYKKYIQEFIKENLESISFGSDDWED